MNKLHLCKPLIRAIEQSNLKEHFARAQLVTYKFYVGKKHMFDSEYRLAEESLSFAFTRCHKASRHNKKLILIYLIPVKMLLGDVHIFPSKVGNAHGSLDPVYSNKQPLLSHATPVLPIPQVRCRKRRF